MPVQIGTREELMSVLQTAVHPGEPERMLAIFRMGGYVDFTLEFGDSAIDSTADDIAGQLPAGAQSSTFYYRPRQDELCVLIEKPCPAVVDALRTAARQVNSELGPNGIALGYATSTLPETPNTVIRALRGVDRRIVDADGKPLRRTYRTDFAILRIGGPSDAHREDWSLPTSNPAQSELVQA